MSEIPAIADCSCDVGCKTGVQFEPYGWIAGYRIDAVLGRGRQSMVYRAWNAMSGRVALKVARRAQLALAGRGGDFSREYGLAIQVAHPGVVKVFDHGFDAKQAWLVMEYIPGGQLAYNTAPLASSEVVRRLRQSAAALAWIHARRLVHQDLKPANLLIRNDGDLVVGDFGCACRQGEVGELGYAAIVGTAQYAAPEQSLGAPAQPTADIYSLGVLLYEWLRGHALFGGKTLTELFCQHQFAAIPRLAGQQAVWQPLLDAMLAKDPQQRLPDGQAVLAVLEQYE